MSEINFLTIDRSELIMHLVDTLLISHEAFKGYHRELTVMYHSDEEIKQLMDAQYEAGRVRTLEYLQMGQDELKTEDMEAASVIVFETVSAIVDVISFSQQRIATERLKSELVHMIVSYLYK
ncbi:hypothetical protein D3C75_924550 [compost metagenome]